MGQSHAMQGGRQQPVILSTVHILSAALWKRTKPRFQMKGHTWPQQHVDGTAAHSLLPVTIKTCTGGPPAMVLRMLKSSKVPSGRTTWKHFDPFCAWGRI